MAFSLEYARKLLKSSKPETLQQAFDLLESIGPGSSPLLPEILRLLDHKDKKITWLAARLLSFIGPDALPGLLVALSTAPSQRAIAAVRAIGNLGEEAAEALPALQGTLATHDPLLLHEAAKAIGHLKERGLPALHTLLRLTSHRDSSVRFSAIFAIGEIQAKTPEVLAACDSLLADTDDTVRWAAIRTLASFGPEAAFALPRLLPLLQNLNSDVACHTALAIGAIGASSPEIEEALRQALYDERPDLKEAVISSICSLRLSSLLLGPLLSPAYLLPAATAAEIFPAFASLPGDPLGTLLLRMERCVPSDRWVYAVGLCYLPPTPQSLSALSSVLRDAPASFLSSFFPHLPALASAAWPLFPLLFEALRGHSALWFLLETFLPLPEPCPLPLSELLESAHRLFVTQTAYDPSGLATSHLQQLLFRFLARHPEKTELRLALEPRLLPPTEALAPDELPCLLRALPLTSPLPSLTAYLSDPHPSVRWEASFHLHRTKARPLQHDEEAAILQGELPHLRLLLLLALSSRPEISPREGWLFACSSLEAFLRSSDPEKTPSQAWFLALLQARRHWLEKTPSEELFSAPESPRVRFLARFCRPRISFSTHPTPDPLLPPFPSPLPSSSQVAFWLTSSPSSSTPSSEIRERIPLALWLSSLLTQTSPPTQEDPQPFLLLCRGLQEILHTQSRKSQQQAELRRSLEEQLF